VSLATNRIGPVHLWLLFGYKTRKFGALYLSERVIETGVGGGASQQ
jgi:hypothetical protein